MTTKFLLPCECGEKLSVDVSESGLTRKCQCGAELEVPTLRGLRKLERVVDQAAPAKPAWGNRQRGVAVGLLISLVGFGLGLYWWLSPALTPYDFYAGPLGAQLPEDPEPHLVLGFFDFVVQPQGLYTEEQKHIQQFHRLVRKDRWWTMSAFGLGVIGLLVIGVTLLMTIPRRPVPRPAAPTGQPAPAKTPPAKQPS